MVAMYQQGLQLEISVGLSYCCALTLEDAIHNISGRREFEESTLQKSLH